ncbi:MAG: DUF3868 domain-containing protein, partial [Muribaculaceae bacterium]|nr:DUF3868 domain-containing protein [Muribaculaceae bacterium]
MKRYIQSIAACALLALGASAATPAFKVYDVDVDVNERDSTLSVNIDLRLKEIKLGRDQETILTPVIISADGEETAELAPITICGRNRYYYYLRQGLLDKGDHYIYRAGKDGFAHITETVPFEKWMGHSTVEMRQEAATCCNPANLVPGATQWGNTELAVIETERPAMHLDFVFAPPVDDKPVEKNIEGRAFVSFVVDRTELKPDYMVNRREIAKILNSIDYVRQDSDAVITGVHIKGYASPEATYAHNTKLAQGRTATLANYVRNQYHFADGIITTSYDPEDWGGLRNYITDSLDYNIEHRTEILDIIDGPLGFDAKEM